jgi:hypothetical protein
MAAVVILVTLRDAHFTVRTQELFTPAAIVAPHIFSFPAVPLPVQWAAVLYR